MATGGDDLLVVGPGVLGGYAGKLWLEEHPSSTVVGLTNTEENHPRLLRLGLQPATKPWSGERFDNVLFSAPPSGSSDYVAEVKSALDRWTGDGCFVFTGSAGVQDVPEDCRVDDDTPAVELGKSDRLDRLVLSERAVLEAGGCVVRYVGLYHAHRGAHTYFLRMGEVDRWGGSVINLIHYEDAASLAITVLKGQGGDHHRARVFLGCDGFPVTMREMMDAVAESPMGFEGSCTFTGEEPQGSAHLKRASNPRTRSELCWEPKHISFRDFMLKGAEDFYSSSAWLGA